MSDLPRYGVCASCGRPIRLTRTGLTRSHPAKVHTAWRLRTATCPGSGSLPTAPYTDTPEVSDGDA